MRTNLTKTQKAKIVLDIIDDLKNLPNKDVVYIYPNSSNNHMLEKIAERSGIECTDWRGEGAIDITEDIEIAFDWRCDKLQDKLEGRIRPYNFPGALNFEVSEELKLATEEFEKKNIPSSGTCKTHIGELFRAIQYIQYRAHNDGDLCWDPGSPSFTSYVYLKSQIDKLNYHKEEGFIFTDPYLNSPRNTFISDLIEDPLAKTADYIRYQLMDLILSGELEDKSNEFDSRSFTRLDRGTRY